MANLTKKDIQQLLGAQTKELKVYIDVQDKNIVKELKGYTDGKIDGLEKRSRDYADEQTEKLARIIAVAFEGQNKYLDQRFNDLEKKLDVRKIVEEHEKKFAKLEHALNLKF